MSTYEADPTRFCTPATELVFALAVAGLSGAEYSVMLAAIGHCFGPPRYDLKGTLLKVSRYFLAKHLPFGQSTVYDAIESLVRRGLLRTAANKCLIINKRLHEWRDADGADLFSPRAAATVSMYGHLAKWPWFVELAGKVPLGAGSLFLPPQNPDLADKAETVPSEKHSGTPEGYSGPPEHPPQQISGPPEHPTGKHSGTPEGFFRPTGITTPENGANEAQRAAKEKDMADRFDWPEGADASCDRLVTYARTIGRLDGAEAPKLLSVLETCLHQGVDPSILVRAVEDYANSDAPELLRSALAFIRSRINAPKKATTPVRRSYVQWCAQRPAGAKPPTAPQAKSQAQLAAAAQLENEQRKTEQDAAAKAQSELHALAAAFTARPAAVHLQVIDELRRGGESLHVVRVEAWRAEGAAPWRTMPEGKRKSWARALAAAERCCRGALAEHLTRA